MEINSIANLDLNYKSNKPEAEDKKYDCPICKEIQASSLDALAVYNQPAIKPNFNPEYLPATTLDEEFDVDELSTRNLNDFTSYAIIDMASGYTKECIRNFENYGILPNGYVEKIEEQCEEYGINSLEHKMEITDIEREIYAQNIEDLKNSVLNNMSKIPPTTKPHTVYRVISSDYSQSYKNMEKKLNSLKKGEEFKLDSCPIYVSTSAKKIMSNYGSSARNGFLFEIRLPKGSQLYKFPHDGIEQCIMKPDAKFKLVGKQEYANNFTYMILEYIPE